jgi:hypothetical protein
MKAEEELEKAEMAAFLEDLFTSDYESVIEFPVSYQPCSRPEQNLVFPFRPANTVNTSRAVVRRDVPDVADIAVVSQPQNRAIDEEPAPDDFALLVHPAEQVETFDSDRSYESERSEDDFMIIGNRPKRRA